MIYGGKCVISNRFMCESLYVLYSFSLIPLNFDSNTENGICGMIFSLISSGYRGGGGKSHVRYNHGISSILSEKTIIIIIVKTLSLYQLLIFY